MKLRLKALLAATALAVGASGCTISTNSGEERKPSNQPSFDAGSDTVARAVDGDTLELEDGTQVRILGIDTPERGQCGYEEATDALAELLDGKEVSLTVSDDTPDTDKYGRLLRHVKVGRFDVGTYQIENGWANARYDSQDGYAEHKYENAYRGADEKTTHFCPELD